MKYIALFALAILGSCTNRNSVDFEKLYGNWQMEQILVNGEADPENFPVSNDEINFRRDMTFVTREGTHNYLDTSTWEIKKPNKFIVATTFGLITFTVNSLTTKKLEVQTLLNETDVVLIYTREK